MDPFLFERSLSRISNWGYFNTCANWASSAVSFVICENVDASDYVLFGTPRAISQSIINLERITPTQVDIPLFGGEDAPHSIIGYDGNDSSSMGILGE